MTRFTDGPAQGVILSLKRNPLFLRVTHDGDDGHDGHGNWDALDQLDDTPKPGEAIHVYLMVSDDGTCFVDGTDKQGRRRGWTERSATYRLHSEQPDDETARSKTAWPVWVQAQYDSLCDQERQGAQ